MRHIIPIVQDPWDIRVHIDCGNVSWDQFPDAVAAIRVLYAGVQAAVENFITMFPEGCHCPTQRLARIRKEFSTQHIRVQLYMQIKPGSRVWFCAKCLNEVLATPLWNVTAECQSKLQQIKR